MMLCDQLLVHLFPNTHITQTSSQWKPLHPSPSMPQALGCGYEKCTCEFLHAISISYLFPAFPGGILRERRNVCHLRGWFTSRLLELRLQWGIKALSQYKEHLSRYGGSHYDNCRTDSRSAPSQWETSLYKLRSVQNTGTCYPGQGWFVRNLGWGR